MSIEGCLIMPVLTSFQLQGVGGEHAEAGRGLACRQGRSPDKALKLGALAIDHEHLTHSSPCIADRSIRHCGRLIHVQFRTLHVEKTLPAV